MFVFLTSQQKIQKCPMVQWPIKKGNIFVTPIARSYRHQELTVDLLPCQRMI